ncbi:MAG: hypothetical protein J6W62_04320 [Spirochaetia bacterium]|nr:hypothetical protein [Spirochaetia bacterium]
MCKKEELVKIIEELSSEGEEVRRSTYKGLYDITYIREEIFDSWRNKVLAFLNAIKITPGEIILSISTSGNDAPRDIDGVQAQLKTLVDLIENEYIDINVAQNDPSGKVVEQIFDRFHKVVRQLRTRYDNRETICVSDEYDVQDVLHALLVLFFDDVRTEEWTPSYAGGAVRMDFLLKEIQAVIEVKKTRKSMSAKDLGEQLIIDIEKYKTHPDCKQLYCFVYDPEGLLGNPVGIKKDLESAHKEFLKVFVKPE